LTSPGRVAAETYLVAVNAKDRSALASLFAPDVVALNPFGEFVGHDAVLGFYDQCVLANDVSVQATNIIEADTICVVELDGVTPATAEVQRMVDIFTVDEQGQVVRLSIYRR
jgi:hypothetical protein